MISYFLLYYTAGKAWGKCPACLPGQTTTMAVNPTGFCTNVIMVTYHSAYDESQLNDIPNLNRPTPHMKVCAFNAWKVCVKVPSAWHMLTTYAYMIQRLFSTRIWFWGSFMFDENMNDKNEMKHSWGSGDVSNVVKLCDRSSPPSHQATISWQVFLIFWLVGTNIHYQWHGESDRWLISECAYLR